MKQLQTTTAIRELLHLSRTILSALITNIFDQPSHRSLQAQPVRVKRYNKAPFKQT